MTDTKHDYVASSGEHISVVADKLVALAAEKGRRVTAEFNGATIAAEPGTSAADAMGAWEVERQKRYDERQAFLRIKARQDRIAQDIRDMVNDAEHWNRTHPDEEPIVIDTNFEPEIAALRVAAKERT